MTPPPINWTITYKSDKTSSTPQAMDRTQLQQSLSKTAAAPSFIHHGATCDVTAVYRSKTLLVTFDNLASIDDRPSEKPWPPWLAKRAENLGYSILGMQSHQKDWYRTHEPAEQLLTLVSVGYFERFTNILFIGASMGGFAALCFGPLVPGARVAAFSPQSTLNRDIAPFERRYKWPYRKFDWQSEAYLDAAQDLARVPEGYVFFDPFIAEDKRHAARLTGATIQPVAIPHADHTLIRTIVKCGALESLLHDLAAGRGVTTDFWRRMRKRRADPLWARQMLKAAEKRGYGPLLNQAGQFLELEHGHPFAMRIVRRARRAKRQNKMQIDARKAEMPFWTDQLSEAEVRARVPVFIYSSGQAGHLMNTTQWFVDHGFKKLTIYTDQPPHLEPQFIRDKDPDLSLHLVEGFITPSQALEEAALSNEATRGFIFATDGLALPDKPLKNMVKAMFEQGLRHDCQKVGLALSLDPFHIDLDRACDNGKTVEQKEKKNWKHQIDTDVYRAPVDTTFLLYVPKKGVPQPFDASQMRKYGSLRMGGKGFTGFHRPWLRGNSPHAA